MKNFLKEGDIIELTEEHTVYAYVPKHFVYDNYKGDFELTKTNVSLKGELSYLQGKYVVTKTAMTGGGTGHGPHDVYPDGHKVTCESTDDNKRIVSFYQSGCFTAMITDIKPIGKAKLSWVVEE